MTGQTGDTARRLWAAFFSLALLFTGLPGTNWTAFTDPDLRGGDYALVQVAHGTARAVAAKATAAGATDVAALDTIDVVTARLSAKAARALGSDPRVSFIAADTVVTATGDKPHFENDDSGPPPSPALDAIDGRSAWSKATGKGVTVAIMDTGIARHADLEGSVAARVDFVRDGATSLDPGGHGTFVAGLIAAHGRTFKGVAPDAKLVSLRVLDERGNGTMHSVLAAFDWLLRNRAEYRIRVLNLSFGAPQATTYHRTLLSGVVESAWFAGIAVVAAAGNDGPKPGSVTNPGADPFVITVGSLADQGTATFADDRESGFSGRGPTLDGFAKPDVLAPGEHVLSIRLDGSTMDRTDRDPTLDDGYGRISGTSASSAMATGVAALVLQAHRNYSPTQVKGALVAGGRAVTGTRTAAVSAADSLSARPAKVNVGLKPSRVLLLLLQLNGQLEGQRQGQFEGQLEGHVGWGGISWEGISWESVSWEGVTWESVSWESVSWESVTWETVTWELR
ncbi:MAG: S8 family serine peptidase [Chloroflexota bacterium]|nr:S8 family serine peptidase [Chloroflexota bacterium]